MAVLMVPVLLLAKPLLIYRTRMKARHQVGEQNRATLSQDQLMLFSTRVIIVKTKTKTFKALVVKA